MTVALYHKIQSNTRQIMSLIKHKKSALYADSCGYATHITCTHTHTSWWGISSQHGCHGTNRRTTYCHRHIYHLP